MDDAIDAHLERIAREEQDDLDRAHGQHILDLTSAKGQQDNAEDLILEILRQAHQAQAQDD